MATAGGKGLQKHRGSFYCYYSTVDPTNFVLSSGQDALSNLSSWSHDHMKPSRLAEGNAATAATTPVSHPGDRRQPSRQQQQQQPPPLPCHPADTLSASHTSLTGTGCPPLPDTASRDLAVASRSQRCLCMGYEVHTSAQMSCSWGTSPSAHISISHAKHAYYWQG